MEFFLFLVLSLVGPIFGVNVLRSLYRLESGAVKADVRARTLEVTFTSFQQQQQQQKPFSPKQVVVS
jgi:hypothetical protein